MILLSGYTLQCVFHKTKDIFLYNYSTIFKIMKLILIQHYYLLCSLYSDFTNCLSNGNYRKRNLGSGFTFSCQISLFSFSIEVLRFSLHFMKLTSLRTTGQLFCGSFPQISSCLIFAHYYTQVKHLGRNNTEMMLCPQYITLGGICCWFVSLFVVNPDHLVNVVTVMFPHCALWCYLL